MSEIIIEINMRSIIHGNGMHPKYYNEILGKKVSQDIDKGTSLSIGLISK